ncbi:class I adenylate-forming enzyme family protein [Nocardioides sp. NPDC101246]|uniref:class I adenylate-forming enzyme family protein n=1 Tax=Nocardioides sp. NPDC101246 TaxID=3364336 RepID=UPI0037F46ED0
MPTIGGLVLQNGLRVPAREAMVAGKDRLTWEEVSLRARQLATVLSKQGVEHGDRVAIVATNSGPYILAEYATLLLGAIVVPVNAKLTAPEIAVILEDCEPVLVLTDDTTSAPVAAARNETTRDCVVLALALDDAIASAHQTDPIDGDRATESDDAFITYTSGTTGRPKGVLADHHRALWAGLAQMASIGLRDGDRYLHLSPLYHSGGVVFTTVVTLLGGTHVLAGAFAPGPVLELIETEGITAFLGVPTMYQQLLRHPDFDDRDLGSLRVATFGAAAMPGETVEELLARLPAIDLYQLCGQTEAGPTGLFSTTAQVRERPDSTGHQSQPFLAHRLVALDGGPVGEGEVGEVLFQGEAVMKGYWRAPEATAETLTDGWLHTGDLFRRDPDGTLVLVDRRKDVIITGGQNVYSAEVERVVLTHPAVLDCAVIGRPHDEYGETIVAVAQLAAGTYLDLEELRAHCASSLARFKIPRELTVVDTVPRNAGGKLQKHRLRTCLEAD